MKTTENKIKGGVYLVINPEMDEKQILSKLNTIIKQGISAVQIWDNFKKGENTTDLINKIHSICAPAGVLLLINNRWELLLDSNLDGVHFDEIPVSVEEIRSKVKKDIIIGLTCGNKTDTIKWAAENDIDYISFCSMFPSKSAGNCEIVDHSTVRKAREIFKKPLFLAGGIYPEHLKELKELSFDGIAVISGIMNSETPDTAIENYKNILKEIK